MLCVPVYPSPDRVGLVLASFEHSDLEAIQLVQSHELVSGSQDWPGPTSSASRSSVTPNRSQNHRHQVRFRGQSQSRPRNIPCPRGASRDLRGRPRLQMEPHRARGIMSHAHSAVIWRLTNQAQKRLTDQLRHSHELRERGLSQSTDCPLPPFLSGGRESTRCPHDEGRRGE